MFKRSPRTAGGVLPQLCQINWADSYRHLHLLKLGWSRCTQPLSCLTAGKESENGDEQPRIWQIGIRSCVSNTQWIEDVSNHSSFSLLLAYSLPLRPTIKWEKQQRCRLSAARLLLMKLHMLECDALWRFAQGFKCCGLTLTGIWLGIYCWKCNFGCGAFGTDNKASGGKN